VFINPTFRNITTAATRMLRALKRHLEATEQLEALA
jgi:hypothetical protein